MADQDRLHGNVGFAGRRDRESSRHGNPSDFGGYGARGIDPRDDTRGAFRGDFGGYGEGGRPRGAPMHGGFGGEGYSHYGIGAGVGIGHGQGAGGDYVGGNSARPVRNPRYHDDDDQNRFRRSAPGSQGYQGRPDYGVGPGHTVFSGPAARADLGPGPHRGRGPKNYRRSDERIHDDVNEWLTRDPYVDASDIEVTVQNSEVTLSGRVNTRFERRHAEDIVESVAGVTHVQNNLRVGQAHSDALPTDAGAFAGMENPGTSGGAAGAAAGSSSGGRSTGRKPVRA